MTIPEGRLAVSTVLFGPRPAVLNAATWKWNIAHFFSVLVKLYCVSFSVTAIAPLLLLTSVMCSSYCRLVLYGAKGALHCSVRLRRAGAALS